MLVTEERELRIALSDSAALLGISGDASLQFDGNYRVDLEMTTRPDLNAAIVSMLETLTRKNGLNRFQFRQSGQLDSALQRRLESLIVLPE